MDNKKYKQTGKELICLNLAEEYCQKKKKQGKSSFTGLTKNCKKW